MTVSNSGSRIAYTGDGSTTAFSFPYVFLANADLVVLTTISGVQTTKVLGTDYSVSGAGVPTGGTVTFTTAPIAGAYIVIYRDPPVTQTTSYNNNDPFPAKSHETALDKLTMLIQRLVSKVSLFPSLKSGSSFSNITLSDPVASQFLKWSADLASIDSTAIVTVAGSYPVAIQSEAEAGTSNTVIMTPLRADQAALIRSGSLPRATYLTTNVPASVQVLTTSGYYVSGDFGGARYKRAGGAPAHAGYFQSLDGAYWVIIDTETRAAQFGVKGDNNTGSSQRTAETTALNNWLQYLGTALNTGCGLLVGCTGNTFRINGPLLVYPSTVVRGTGWGCTIYSNYAGGIITPYNNAVQRTNNVVLENFAVDGESTASAIGLYLINASLWKCSHILVTNTIYGVYCSTVVATAPFDAANYNQFEHVVCSGVTDGFVFDLDCNSNTMRGCRVGSATFGVIDFGNDNKARDCEFEVVTTGIYCQNGTPAWLTATAYVVGNYVLQGGSSYRCLVSHTSGTFATDLAAAKWVLLAAGGYFSQRFISDGNRFETVTTAHQFSAQSVNPTVISPFYSNVTTQITNNIVTTGKLPLIHGLDGLAIGFHTWFSDIYILAATPNFTAIAAGTSQDQFVSLSGLLVTDYTMAMAGASLAGSLVVTTVPSNNGFYIRITNTSAGSLTPGAQTMPVLVMKKVN